MAPPVITITRQYASGGSEVARLVAAELGWDVIDNERSEEHTSELQSQSNLVCRLLLEKKKKQPSPSRTARPPTPPTQSTITRKYKSYTLPYSQRTTHLSSLIRITHPTPSSTPRTTLPA